jgi:hypothetical protein
MAVRPFPRDLKARSAGQITSVNKYSFLRLSEFKVRRDKINSKGGFLCVAGLKFFERHCTIVRRLVNLGIGLIDRLEELAQFSLQIEPFVFVVVK